MSLRRSIGERAGPPARERIIVTDYGVSDSRLSAWSFDGEIDCETTGTAGTGDIWIVMVASAEEVKALFRVVERHCGLGAWWC